MFYQVLLQTWTPSTETSANFWHAYRDSVLSRVQSFGGLRHFCKEESWLKMNHAEEDFQLQELIKMSIKSRIFCIQIVIWQNIGEHNLNLSYVAIYQFSLMKQKWKKYVWKWFFKTTFAGIKRYQNEKVLRLFGIHWKWPPFFETCHYWWWELGVWVGLGNQTPEHGMAHLNICEGPYLSSKLLENWAELWSTKAQSVKSPTSTGVYWIHKNWLNDVQRTEINKCVLKSRAKEGLN